MKNIIHDWNDEARPPDSASIAAERFRMTVYCCSSSIVSANENMPTVGKAIDLVMLTMTGGRERTVNGTS